ncbi:MAG: hypothetical protein HRU15_16915 [Planctomycetes bacterium]|nr:hypothetical protein [Planctomycetota bacterium]
MLHESRAALPELLAGVPATIGGALYMNAGTSTCWMFDWVSRVEVLLPDEHQPRWLLRDEVPAIYRSSGLARGTIFLQCEMILQAADSDGLKEKASTLKQAKAASQPLSAKSAGCIFKNPSTEVAAGWLIDDLGLKGQQVGGVKVSDIHGNFIVNDGTGSVNDVTTLIQQIRQRAWQEREINLQLEVQCWHCPPELHIKAEDLFR